MRKAKTTLSVLGIVFAVAALLLLVCMPFFDAAAAALTPGAAHGTVMEDFNANITAIIDRVKEIPTALSNYFQNFSLQGKANLILFIFILCFALGTAAFVVTLVILCVKKHAKGLGLLIPLYVVALVALLVFGVLFISPVAGAARYIKTAGYVEGSVRISKAGYYVYFVEMKHFELAMLVVIGLSFAFIGLGFIFYMAYAVKLDKARKEEAKAVEETKAEIKNLIKEALGK